MDGIDQVVAVIEAHTKALQLRAERAEQALFALIKDVGTNPSTAAANAEAILRGTTPFVPATATE